MSTLDCTTLWREVVGESQRHRSQVRQHCLLLSVSREARCERRETIAVIKCIIDCASLHDPLGFEVEMQHMVTNWQVAQNAMKRTTRITVLSQARNECFKTDWLSGSSLGLHNLTYLYVAQVHVKSLKVEGLRLRQRRRFRLKSIIMTGVEHYD